MRQWVAEGRFREDLYARINMWSFALPGLAQRKEDITPNVDYELQRFSRESQTQIRFDKEAREGYLAFACSSRALWRGNFRELSASVARMATLAEQGRITLDLVLEEISRLQTDWQTDVRSLQLTWKSICLTSGNWKRCWRLSPQRIVVRSRTRAVCRFTAQKSQS
jgi:transcriptional regulatory protein RtcR